MHLPVDATVYLVIGGSMGAGDLEKLTGQFLKTRQEGEVFIVVCGNNKKMFQKMKKKYKEQECIVLVGQTRQMEVYMKACDMVYTKPGGLTSTEAAVSQIPMVHTAPIPGCESANRRFFVRHGMSIAPRTVEAQVEQGRALLQNPEKVEAMKKAQKETVSGNSGEEIVRILENLTY